MQIGTAKYRLYGRLPPRLTRKVLLGEDAVRWASSHRVRSVARLGDWLKVKSLARHPGDCRTAETLVTVRALNDRAVPLRRGTTDAQVLLDTFVDRYHLPLGDADPQVIVDLGANIGLTAAHLAHTYPHARVIAVEPEPAMAEIAARNLSSWSDRISLVAAAAWVDDGAVRFAMHSGNEWGGRVDAGADGVEVRAISLNTLLSDEPVVHYVKMDVEGAELDLLSTATEWAVKVREISVECHLPYTQTDAIRDLEQLGFTARLHPSHPTGVYGRRL